MQIQRQVGGKTKGKLKQCEYDVQTSMAGKKADKKETEANLKN